MRHEGWVDVRPMRKWSRAGWFCDSRNPGHVQRYACVSNLLELHGTSTAALPSSRKISRHRNADAVFVLARFFSFYFHEVVSPFLLRMNVARKDAICTRGGPSCVCVCSCSRGSYLDWKSLACMFLVMEGSLTRSPSSSLVMMTWQPRRLVSVRPNARSSMSFSSSSGSGILS